jgi:plastocyanin
MRGAFVRLVVAAAILGTSAAGSVAVAGSATTTATKTVTMTASGCAGQMWSWCYKPATLTVQRGTKVVWKNMTLVPHDVKRCTKAACKASPGTGTDTKFGSKMIGPKKTYTYTFNQPGTYVYYCIPHGYVAMHGTIIVL